MTRPTVRSSASAALVRELCELPNVGPAVAGDFVRLGIKSVDELRRREAFQLYAELARRDGVRHDPCLLDTFLAVIDHLNGAPERPWWHYTPIRKAMLAERGVSRKARAAGRR